MLLKIFIIIILSIYVVLGFWNLNQKDSSFLIEKLYKYLKHLYYHL